MKVKFFSIALTLMTLIACQNCRSKTPAMSSEGQNAKETTPVASETKEIGGENNPALFGKWRGVEWSFMGKPSGEDATQVQFEFKEDGTFQANYGPQNKSGTWRTAKDSLYTTQTGMKELPIKLLKADGSALEFEMNVGGKPEVLKFKKQ